MAHGDALDLIETEISREFLELPTLLFVFRENCISCALCASVAPDTSSRRPARQISSKQKAWSIEEGFFSQHEVVGLHLRYVFWVFCTEALDVSQTWWSFCNLSPLNWTKCLVTGVGLD